MRRNAVRWMRKPTFRFDTFAGAPNELTAHLESNRAGQRDMGAHISVGFWVDWTGVVCRLGRLRSVLVYWGSF